MYRGGRRFVCLMSGIFFFFSDGRGARSSRMANTCRYPHLFYFRKRQTHTRDLHTHTHTHLSRRTTRNTAFQVFRANSLCCGVNQVCHDGRRRKTWGVEGGLAGWGSIIIIFLLAASLRQSLGPLGRPSQMEPVCFCFSSLLFALTRCIVLFGWMDG